MAELPEESPFQKYWGLFIVATVTPLAWFFIAIVSRSYPAFPAIPAWSWWTYLGLQFLSHLNLGYAWKNTWPLNLNRLLFVSGAFLSAVAVLARDRIGKSGWTVAACVLSLWLLLRTIQSLDADKDEFPLANRMVGAIASSFVLLPIVLVCAMAAKAAP